MGENDGQSGPHEDDLIASHFSTFHPFYSPHYLIALVTGDIHVYLLPFLFLL